MATTAGYPRLTSYGIIVRAIVLACSARTARAEDGPSIVKDSVIVTASHISGSEDAPKEKQLQWKPGISFSINGPIPDGSQEFVLFSYPGHKDFAKFDCKPGEVLEGRPVKFEECLAPDKFTTDYTGPVDFAIHL